MSTIEPLLSVVMPVFNEARTVNAILARVRATPFDKEIVCVDDCSTDGTAAQLEAETREHPETRVFRHEVNQGKGAAVATGLKQVRGKIAIIQDADLEYDPNDYAALLAPIMEGRTKAVYGSRFLGKRQDMASLHAAGNRFLTAATNILYGVHLTDMETCYKVFTADIARQLKLTSHRWGFDPEITARILRMGHRIEEVPISYAGRQEGKKISWKDGFVVMYTLVRCRLSS